MKWALDISFEQPSKLIHHSDPILLMGSCFTDNIGKALNRLFFNTCANPCGILFDPASICRVIQRALDKDYVKEDELLFYNERYQSLDFHSDCSDTSKEEALRKMNLALTEIHDFLPKAKHLILTFGSAFSYRHKEYNQFVTNCHQFPADQFEKVLWRSEEVQSILQNLLNRLNKAFPDLHILLTVSPVRHIRDGVVANNRSKARLLEAVHYLSEENATVHYFPAYEWVIDVLRDYRWYDIDLVHPNYAATESVFEQFCMVCMDTWTQGKLKDLHQLRLAEEHRPRFPDTRAHQQFLLNTAQRKKELIDQMPWIKV